MSFGTYFGDEIQRLSRVRVYDLRRIMRALGKIVMAGTAISAVLIVTGCAWNRAERPERSVARATELIDEFRDMQLPSESTGAAGTEPIAAGIGLHPTQFTKGDSGWIGIKVRTAPSWHIFSLNHSRSSGVATELKLELPAGIQAEGEWMAPKPKAPELIYEGTILFRRKLTITPAAAAGPFTLRCQLTYQACDPVVCWPARTIGLEIRGEVLRSE